MLSCMSRGEGCDSRPASGMGSSVSLWGTKAQPFVLNPGWRGLSNIHFYILFVIIAYFICF